MSLYSLLEVGAQTTNLVKWISVGAIVLLLVLVAFLGFGTRKIAFDARRLAFAGVCVAMSFVLAIIKFKPVQYGGSITLASFVPILVFAYIYGPIDGFLVGLVHGLLNFVESPYILTPATFTLDYLLAFAGVGFMGFFGKNRKQKAVLPLVLGCLSVFSFRFLAHFLSGVIFFLQDSVWVSLPQWAMSNAFAYSFLYQCVYLPADGIIAALALIALAKSGILDKLALQMTKNSKTNQSQKP